MYKRPSIPSFLPPTYSLPTAIYHSLAGTYSAARASECTDCRWEVLTLHVSHGLQTDLPPIISFLSPPTTPFFPFSVGSYSETDTAYACLTCSAGTYQDEKGARSTLSIAGRNCH